MTWEDDMVCHRCAHSIEVHMNNCLVPDCDCRKSADRIYDLCMARSMIEGRS